MLGRGHARAAAAYDSVINGQTLSYWDHWHAVMESERRACEIMLSCVARTSKAWLSKGWNGWILLVKQSAAETEMESLLDRLKREKHERAGRVMRYSLNRISSRAFVQCFDKWKSVMAAYQKSGKVMQVNKHQVHTSKASD